MKRTGNINAARIVVDGIPAWAEVPAVLVPGNMDAFGIYDDCFQECNLAADRGPVGYRVMATNGTWATADVAGGVMQMNTSDTADNDVIQITLGGDDGGAFWCAANVQTFFEIRCRQTILGTNTLNLAFGLQDPANTEYLADAGAGPAVNNHLMFLTLDTGAGVNAWSFEGDLAGTTDRNALSTNLDSLTWHTYGFFVDGITACYVYYDRAYVAAGLVATASIPITGLMPFVCIKDGNVAAMAEYIQIDYIMCIQTRA